MFVTIKLTHYLKKNANCGSSGRFALKRQMRTSSMRGRFRAPLRTSRFIGEPLALDALKGDLGTAHVINSKTLAIAIAEIELCQIAVQMGFADVVINADDPATCK